MNISVNKSAPVFSSSEIIINASIGTVWEIVTDIKKWPDWQSSVSEVNFEDQMFEGLEFTWKADGIKFKSKVHTIKQKSLFGWTGKTIGAHAIHNWTFSEQNNTTIVKVEESLQGVLPMLLRSYFQKSLDKGLVKNLNELKIASELK